MKVLQLISSLETGGAEKLVIDLIPRLGEYGIQSDLLVFDGTSTTFMKTAISRRIKVFNLGEGKCVYSPFRLLRLFPYLKRYDIIHTHLTAPQYFGAIGSLFRKKILVTTEHNTYNRRRQWKVFGYIDRWMYNRYSTIICVSDKTKENLIRHVSHSKANILTIKNGVEVSEFLNATPTGDLEKIAPASKKIVMVAAFRREKDQDTLVRALRYLPNEFHLFLVGTGVRRAEVEWLVKEEKVSDRVHFMGERGDIPKLLKSADYIVMSSHYEGLSLSSVEGMASGKPFIASDVDGLCEVVEDKRLLFPRGDAEALAQRITSIEASDQLYEEITENCKRRSLDIGIENVAKAYSDVYHSILPGGNIR